MRKLTFKNASGATVEIYRRPYLLQKLDISPLVDEPITTRGHGQDGESYKCAYAQPRDMVIVVAIFGSNIDKAVREFKQIFNPKLGEGILTLENSYLTREITVKVDAEPQVSYEAPNYIRGLAVASVSLTAYDPYWRDVEYTEIELSGLTDLFYWDTPEYFYEDKPFFMGQVESSSKTVENKGDKSAPLIIEWEGTSTNPKIMLEGTEQFIKLDEALSEDEKLIITTGYGEKTVSIVNKTTGEVTKDFSVTDDDSSFFELPMGESTLSFSADSGAKNAYVRIRFKNYYTGV